jgi:conjugative relaxase-like TrwC/TraI family protein
MLSIGKLAHGQADYYLGLAGERVDRSASVSSGVEDYYVGGAEPPGRWTGRLAAELGRAGRVDGAALKEVLAVDDVGLPEILGRRSVPGYDLTFSAPKSVSVVFGIAEAPVRDAVLTAHRVAVNAALTYVEREAIRVRRGHAGTRQLETDGMVAAAFDHRTSRAGDPQLHTHVLVANRSRGVDGRWSALDSRSIYRHAKTAGFVYQAVLRSELSGSLGVGWMPRANGVGEIAGVPKDVVRAFSRRRVEIEAEMERLAVAGRQAAQTAALATRRSKDYDVTPERLRPGWRARAEEFGFGVDQLTRLLHEPPARERRIGREELFAELSGPGGLTARRSTFSRRDLLQVLAERSDPSEPVSVEGLRTLADAFWPPT